MSEQTQQFEDKDQAVKVIPNGISSAAQAQNLLDSVEKADPTRVTAAVKTLLVTAFTAIEKLTAAVIAIGKSVTGLKADVATFKADVDTVKEINTKLKTSLRAIAEHTIALEKRMDAIAPVSAATEPSDVPGVEEAVAAASAAMSGDGSNAGERAGQPAPGARPAAQDAAPAGQPAPAGRPAPQGAAPEITPDIVAAATSGAPIPQDAAEALMDAAIASAESGGASAAPMSPSQRNRRK